MPSQVHAFHILVKTEEEAKQIISDLNSGANFTRLAQMKSMCPSAKRGGDLGWFGRGKMVREFENAAFTLKPNQISAPVKTEFGWHVIKVAEAK